MLIYYDYHSIMGIFIYSPRYSSYLMSVFTLYPYNGREGGIKSSGNEYFSLKI